MRKLIFIGECNYNIVLDAAGTPVGAMPGGVIACAAAVLGKLGYDVLMASEAATDAVGDLVVKRLMAANVDVRSVDRYTEGRTALNVYVRDSQGAASSAVRYEAYPDEAFDIVWPRIEADDIVVFGGYYAVDPRMRKRLQQLINNAAERKAMLVYLPGFIGDRQPRLTRIMPQIFENLEIADLLITRSSDLEMLFGVKSPQECYLKHIDFYCRSLVNIDQTCARISYYSGKQMSCVDVDPACCSSMMWQAGVVAGIVGALSENCSGRDALLQPDASLRESIIKGGASCGCEQAKTINNEWQINL